MAQVLAFTVLVPLPHDLQLAGVTQYGYEDGEPWPGWTQEQMGSLLRLGGPVPANSRPSCRFIFRSISVGRRSSPRGADQSFDDIVKPALRRRERFARRLGQVVDHVLQRRERSTAVAVTTYQLREGDPLLEEQEVSRLTTEALDVLNDYLSALGMGGRDALVGAISRADLPVSLWCRADFFPGSELTRALPAEEVGIHVWSDDLLGRPRDPEDMKSAAQLFRAGREGNEPAWVVYDLRHTAVRELLAGHSTEAAVASRSAVEVMIDMVLRRTWAAVGLGRDSLQDALDSGLRDRLEQHLSRILQVPIDVSDLSTEPGRWWRDAHLLRNKAIHEGRRPSFEEAAASIDATYDMMVFVGSRLERRAATRGLAGALPTERWSNRRYGDLDPTGESS